MGLREKQSVSNTSNGIFFILRLTGLQNIKQGISEEIRSIPPASFLRIM